LGILPGLSFVADWFCFVFEAGSYHVAQGGLKLSIFLSAGITDVQHNTWPLF
jgi:hypothetical protein